MTDREFWKARERCVECHCRDAFTMAGRALCAVCAEKSRALARKRYEATPEKYQERDRRYYDARKAARLCVKCGKPVEPDNPRVRCLKCTRKLSAEDRSRNERNRPPEQNWPRGDNGICYICNRRPTLPGRNCCGECYPWLRDNMLAAKAVQNLAAHPWNRGREREETEA